MIEKVYSTKFGDIHYWTNEFTKGKDTLVFLPGLTADHRLFDKQIEYFKPKYNCLVWDAPGHFYSRPFTLDFDLMDKAKWLKEILEREKIVKPIIIGQSMGGYVGQTYLELFPNDIKGFVSIDSAPLQRCFTTGIEIWLLKRMEPIYSLFPYNRLLIDGSKGVATSEYGINLMKEMILSYKKDEYVKLVSHGYRILAEAYEKDLGYKITCKAMLICGEKDKAGSTKNYNKRWAKETNLEIHWLKDAGHNSNSDKPDEVNELIEDFVEEI